MIGPMPSRELGERWPDLIPIGGHPAVDMPPHVVEAAAEAARRPTYASSERSSASLPSSAAAIASTSASRKQYPVGFTGVLTIASVVSGPTSDAYSSQS